MIEKKDTGICCECINICTKTSLSRACRAGASMIARLSGYVDVRCRGTNLPISLGSSTTIRFLTGFSFCQRKAVSCRAAEDPIPTHASADCDLAGMLSSYLRLLLHTRRAVC